MERVAELSLKDIKKAMKMLDKYNSNPQRYFYMSHANRECIEKILEPQGIAKIENVDGKEFFWGLEVIMLPEMPSDVYYISDIKPEPFIEERT